MSENDNDNTIMYGDSDKNKTETYGNSTQQNTNLYSSNQEETSLYSEIQNKEFKSRTHGIGIGDQLRLKNTHYTIKEIISEGTGEAVIYKIENANNQTFALKLYFEFSNSKEEPNFETLNRIKNITDPDILKLHDFGVGIDKYQGKYCYEVSDYAEGGDLFAVSNFKAKYKNDFIETKIVPEILNGIRKLHELKIYHCDLKPSNIFYKDINQTDILIGDYGSAKAYDLETEKEIRKSSTVKGTDAYLAPEQARGIISEKNDYYSFGIILLQLLYPEQISRDNNIQQVDNKKFEKIIERQYNTQPVIDFNPLYQRLNNLIEGLTLVNHINRFGKNELEKWLKGETIEVKYKATEISTIQPVKLGYATIKTDKDFIKILETRNTWWEEVFEDPDTYIALKSWIGSYQDISSRKIFDEMIQFYKPYGKEYVKEAAIRYFNPEKEIRIDMNSFDFYNCEDIYEEVIGFIKNLDDIYKITNFEKIRFYLFQLEFTLQQIQFPKNENLFSILESIKEKIYSAFGSLPKDFKDYKTQLQDFFNKKNEIESYEKLIELFYSFLLKRTYKDTNNKIYLNVEEITLAYAKDENQFFNKINQCELKIFLKKHNLKYSNCNDISEFIFSVFNIKIKSNLKIESIDISDKKIIIIYSINKSLIEFFASQGINKNFLIIGQHEKIEFEINVIPSPKTIYSKFIQEICNINSINFNSIEKKSLLDSDFLIRQYIKKYKRINIKKASQISIGIISFILPVLISIFGVIILIFNPTAISAFFNIHANSDFLLPALIGCIYLLICIFFIPATLYWFLFMKNEKSYSCFEKKEYLIPHQFMIGILSYSVISVLCILAIYLILMVIIGIGSFFGDFETGPTVMKIINFILNLSTVVVFFYTIRPLYYFLNSNKKSSNIIKYFVSVISTIYFIILISILVIIGNKMNFSEILFENKVVTNEDQNPPSFSTYIVISNNVNIRSQPSLKSKKIGKLKKNDTIQVIQHIDENWVEIKYDTTLGYVHTSLIKPL